MLTKKSDEKLIEHLYLKTTSLMSEASDRMAKKEPGFEKYFYSPTVHSYLQMDTSIPHMQCPREIYLPLPENEWPLQYKELLETYASGMSWPNYSTLSYLSDILFSPNVKALLYSGYAVCDEVLIRCSFFGIIQLTEQEINSETIAAPEIFVIDTLAKHTGKRPECYIGMPIRKQHMESWYLSKDKSIPLLELEVKDLIQNKH